MFYLEKLKYEFKFRKKEHQISLLVRYLSIFLSLFYTLAFSFALLKSSNVKDNFLLFFSFSTFATFISHFGFFFITTKASRKFKIFSTFVYLPTMLLSPILYHILVFELDIAYFLGGFYGGTFIYYLFMLTLFLGSLLPFIYFYPWRK